MKRFLAFFYTDLQWKILSLGLAFLLWFVSSIINDPMQNVPYNFLPLQLHNIGILENAELIVLNEDALDVPVQVVVHAPRSEHELLTDADMQLSRIIPSVDFRAINVDDVLNSNGPVTYRLYISINLYPGLERTSIHPRFIDVEIDVIERRDVPVEINVLGTVSQGFVLRQVSLANNNVTIDGPRTVLDTVAGVRVNVDVSGMHSDQEVSNLPLVVFDHAGYDITDLIGISVRETTAFIQAWPVLPTEIRVQAVGNVVDGFVLAEVGIQPMLVDLVGPPDVLLGMEYLLVQVELSEADGGFVQDIDLTEWLPSDVYLHSNQSPSAEIWVTLDPIIRRIFHVSREDIRVRGATAMYHILTDTLLFRLDVSGPSVLINEMDYTNIGLELDLRRLPIGVHDVTLAVSLPAGMTLAAAVPRLQVQIHEPAVDSDDDYDHYNIDNALQYPQTPIILPPDNDNPNPDDNDNGDYDEYSEDDDYGYDDYDEDDNYENAPPAGTDI